MNETYRATKAAQRAAADPAVSAFVAANAGAGKTTVLIDRVARLLLAGVDPSKIVCITYTRAAAAEMADRLFKRLGAWTLAGDAALADALEDLEGARTHDADALRHARRLFARALETPGGLKIQTIHAFCERLLRRFPLEAGAPPGFDVLDDDEASACAEAAIAAVARRAARDSALGAAFDALSEGRTGGALRDMLRKGLERDGAALDGVSDSAWSAERAATIARLGVAPGERAEQIRDAALAALAAIDLARLGAALRAGAGNAVKAADAMQGYFASADPAVRWNCLVAALFKADGDPKTHHFPDKASVAADADAPMLARAAQAVIAPAKDRMARAQTLRRTLAYCDVMRALFDAFRTEKRRRGALDFDDLIAYAARLMASPSGVSWVHYKLDQGVDHVLLDEAQDTSPAAWRLIESLIGEFYSGDGARAGARTFFAVGDQKQSIYSFQGADAALFEEKRADLAKRIVSAGAPFLDARLDASFRSTPAVLGFVDALFADPEALENVDQTKPLRHQPVRENERGRVELWPTPPAPQRRDPEPWHAPLDYVGRDDPRRALPRAVAERIAGWLTSGAILESKGRPIRPDDVMILVQSRGSLFFEMIRALAAVGAPVAGADSGDLLEEAAALDLMSLARAALHADDDLSLAEALRSPFFDVDEESLMRLAMGRGGARLAEALERRAQERPEWSAAAQAMRLARACAAAEGPFAFLSHALETGAPSGWARLARRLGPGAREPAEEMLRLAARFEAREARSLRLFVNALAEGGAAIKRETAEARGVVRVMTAHKAKGLEAPIVFLLDAQKKPKETVGPLLRVDGALVMIENKAQADGGLAPARARAIDLKYDEYRRLMYVAATRARDRLIVCGVENRQYSRVNAAPARRIWRHHAERAFDATPNDEAEEIFGARARVIESGHKTAEPAKPEGAPAVDPYPEFLDRPAPPERGGAALSPSRLAERYEARQARAYAPGGAGGEALRRGAALHRLIELLPEAPVAARRDGADRLLRKIAPDIDDGVRAKWRDEALRVLEDPIFAPAFATTSIAEAGVAGRPTSGPLAGVLIDGRIDRLAVGPDFALAVDFKTNRPPPARVEDTPAAYLAQMAAYRDLLREIFPGRRIETALLWTYEARLERMPDALLDAALAKIS